MTASLPPEVRECFARFVTTEFTTIDGRQQPITWPVTPYYVDGGPQIELTTGLGYPKKADDAAPQPAGRAAVQRSHRLGPLGCHPGAGPGHGHRRRLRSRGQP